MAYWTLEEDARLHLLVRKYFTLFRKSERFDQNSEVAKQLHVEFNSKERDVASLLFRLKEAKLFTFANRPGSPNQLFRIKEANDKCLYDFTVCTPLLRKAQHRETILRVVEYFSSITDEMSAPEAIKQISAELMMPNILVEKILVDADKIQISNYNEYTHTNILPPDVSSLIELQTPEKTIIKEINKIRKKVSELYKVHDRDGAECIFSSDGTGFGKSYGVFESYADYIERFRARIGIDVLLPSVGFTNFVFLTPLKSQIDLENDHIKRIKKAGGEFICVISQADTYDLDFVDWTSGLTNRDRYNAWCEVGSKNSLIKSQLDRLAYLMTQSDSMSKKLNQIKQSGDDEYNEKKMLEEQLMTVQSGILNIIQDAAKSLIIREDSHEDALKQYIYKGLEERKKRIAKQSHSSKLNKNEVYLDILKQVLPFEICQFIPSVLLMTTSKFDTTTLRIIPKKRGEGSKFQAIRFEYLIGGKLKNDDEDKDKNNQEKSLATSLSEACDMSISEQAEYLQNVHFKTNPYCPFRKKDIRFSVVVDELHTAYERLVQSCYKKLVSNKNNLAHVFSVVGRIYQEVNNLTKKNIPDATRTDFEKESVSFIATIENLLENSCKLSPDTSLDSFLKMFNNQLGAFEVNSDSAERIISITKNIFSFNAKMYVNEQALKRIRLRHVNGNETRIELYYEIKGDILDKNPTLHDLFQVVTAVLAACSQIKNAQYKRWVKTGGQEQAPSQNTPLGEFVDAANKVSEEIRHVFERDTNEHTQINHFYTYLLPKTVFTMSPVGTLNFYNKGAERSVILAFEMDLIKEMPEAMLMRMLSGTNNKILALSATSGFSNTQNGNINRNFLKIFSRELGYKVITRQSFDTPLLEKLRDERAKLRRVSFEVFDSERLHFTNTCNSSSDFKAVYNDIFRSIEEVMGNELSNPYKVRQISREIEALLLAAYDKKNTLVLSLSGDFKRAFAKAHSLYELSWRKKYGIRLLNESSEELEQIFEFLPFKNKNRLRVVFFDSALARTMDVHKYTVIEDPAITLVFMSSYNSAGTGLNYFVTYKKNESTIDVDFQRLVLANSPFYSEVKGIGDLNTLPNYVTILKHMADSLQTFLVKDMTVNFANGDNYRLLMAEHFMSLFKVIIQAIGRVERRDTIMQSEIFMPSDVIDNVVFQFAALKQNPENEIVLECMSLLNYELKKYCEKESIKGSFTSSEARVNFEKRMMADGRQIQQVHKRILTQDWINRVRDGELEYLEACNLFRDPLSFTNPSLWLEKLFNNPIVNSNKHMSSIHNKMFIPTLQKKDLIKICHKRGNDGLPEKMYWALSDYAGGAGVYSPSLRIFPQYSKGIVYAENDVVGNIIKYFSKIQKTAFLELLPHPEMIPLLKGNVGESIFDMILKDLNISCLTENEVFEKLSSKIYELFDRFIEIDDSLICIDVKNWTIHLDNYDRDSETIEKTQNKILQVSKTVNENICNFVTKQYKKIKFIYVNTSYSLNPNNLMSEENSDHSVYFHNLFTLENFYQQQRDRKTNKPIERSILKQKIALNQQLISLLK